MKKDIETILCALEDAISDRESYLDSHMTDILDRATGKWSRGPMPGWGKVIRRTKSILKRYRDLVDKLRSKKIGSKNGFATSKIKIP